MKIIAFAATSSRESINKQLVTYASSLIDGADVEVLDINDYEMPLFSTDREKELGQPAEAKAFYEKLGSADAIVISFAEHNGSYTAAYKNLFDWTSRVDMKLFQNTPVVVLATSPGPGGAKNVLATAVGAIPHFGGSVIGDFSLPSFFDNFDMDQGKVKDETLNAALVELMAKVQLN
ncbi:NADPH-dependent FMN reductase [Vibrio penaeicida]|uniref:FMN reductase n=1 Tax=Vibrio penaeicida TaxID=104609 RepID=A0AAV5NJT0_9VIBR|nr:NAD(P)H-dependent oxidoreductase [Vibrio penaeicida]RTZ19178.1 NADPH-dependent oxidoreductase [Vibrio penaeicida]GLQ70830.1 FMN reductase [Vibrio penaeicida]